MNKLIDHFRKPSAKVLAQQELDEARRELLRAQTSRDYAEAICQYQTSRITRLEAVLSEVSR